MKQMFSIKCLESLEVPGPGLHSCHMGLAILSMGVAPAEGRSGWVWQGLHKRLSGVCHTQKCSDGQASESRNTACM